jgi:plastocyanin
MTVRERKQNLLNTTRNHMRTSCRTNSEIWDKYTCVPHEKDGMNGVVIVK